MYENEMTYEDPRPLYWAATSEENYFDEMETGYAEQLGISVEEFRRQEAEHNEAMEREEREAAEAGGLRLCPSCGHRSVRVRSFPTRQYGGGMDSTEVCEHDGCEYAEVYV